MKRMSTNRLVTYNLIPYFNLQKFFTKNIFGQLLFIFSLDRMSNRELLIDTSDKISSNEELLISNRYKVSCNVELLISKKVKIYVNVELLIDINFVFYVNEEFIIDLFSIIPNNGKLPVFYSYNWNNKYNMPINKIK